MPSKSVRFLAVAAAVLLFGAVTDQVSSQKLSSLAVLAFNSAVGTAIDLVAPSPPAAPSDAQSSKRPRSGSISEASSPVATASVRETDGSATGIDLVEPSEPETNDDDDDSDASSRSTARWAGAFGGARRSTGGWGPGAGAAGSVGGVSAGTDSVALTESRSGRLDELMEIAISDLDRDYQAAVMDPSRDQWSNSSSPEPPSARSANPTSSGPSSATPPGPTTDGSGVAPVGAAPSDAPVTQEEPPTWASGLVIDPVDIGFAPPAPADPVVDDQVILDLLPEVPGVTKVAFTPSSLEAPMPGRIVVSPTFVALNGSSIVNPEPASLVLLGTGLAFAAIRMRRRKRS